MGFASQVIADNSGKWVPNALVFATSKEAAAYASDLAWRWTSVRQTRVVEVHDEPTHRWDDHTRQLTDLKESTTFIPPKSFQL
jgi:hypothetical protein